MQLTRRDALAALGAAGVVGGGTLLSSTGEDGTGPLDDRALETLVAAAEVLYPSTVEGIDRFVRRFARGRAADRPDHAVAVADATAYLDEYVDSWYGGSFATVDPATRDEALRRMGADGADADPSGSDVERVRYYVVDELLFALYTSPTGGELVGIENPQGHPGGIESYRRGPEP